MFGTEEALGGVREGVEPRGAVDVARRHGGDPRVLEEVARDVRLGHADDWRVLVLDASKVTNYVKLLKLPGTESIVVLYTPNELRDDCIAAIEVDLWLQYRDPAGGRMDSNESVCGRIQRLQRTCMHIHEVV